MKIGILGAGGIARTMAYTVRNTKNAELAAIGSRSIGKAEIFAAEFGVPKAYGSYEELAADKDIDLVYIATPHSRHYEDCMLCMENGRNVLCEKAFTANARQAVKLIQYSEEHGIFLGEAMWTRFMPLRFVLDDILQSGIIGRITSLTANLGYPIENVERLREPALAGGALLDLGVYTINFAAMVMGAEVESIVSSCVKNDRGVDMHNSIIMNFSGGRTALLHSNMTSATDRRGVIYGTLGRIEVKNINNYEGISVYLNDGEVKYYLAPPQVSGYEYELEAAMSAVERGKTEYEEMPHSETLRIMRIMDDLRAEWGIRFPFE